MSRNKLRNMSRNKKVMSGQPPSAVQPGKARQRITAPTTAPPHGWHCTGSSFNRSSNCFPFK